MPHLSASCRRTSARTKFSVISVVVTEATSLAKEPKPKDPLENIWDHLRSFDSNLDDRMRGYTVQNMADKQLPWYQPCELRQSAWTGDARTHETPTITSMDLTMTISTIEPTWAHMSQHLQIVAKSPDSYQVLYWNKLLMLVTASAFEARRSAPGKIGAGIANLQLLQILLLAQVVSLLLQWLP